MPEEQVAESAGQAEEGSQGVETTPTDPEGQSAQAAAYLGRNGQSSL